MLSKHTLTDLLQLHHHRTFALNHMMEYLLMHKVYDMFITRCNIPEIRCTKMMFICIHNYYYNSLVLLFQYLRVAFNFSPVSSQSFGLRSLL